MACDFTWVKYYCCQKLRSLCKQLLGISRKLVLVLATFTPVTEISKEDKIALARILYIYYLSHFQKDNKNKVQVLIYFGSNTNMIKSATD